MRAVGEAIVEAVDTGETKRVGSCILVLASLRIESMVTSLEAVFVSKANGKEESAGKTLCDAEPEDIEEAIE